MTRRDRAIRPPAGFYEINSMHKHVVMAGCGLFCCACGVEGSTGVTPREPAYNDRVEDFLRRHRGCADQG